MRRVLRLPNVLGQLRGQGQADRVEILGRERKRLIAALGRDLDRVLPGDKPFRKVFRLSTNYEM